MHRSRAVAVLLAVGAVAAGCGSGHTATLTAADRDCTAVTQAAARIQLVNPAQATASDATRSADAASALTQASANATTAVAGPAGQLATAARTYADALAAHNVEAATVSGGLLRQRAQSVANVCKTSVLGVAPNN